MKLETYMLILIQLTFASKLNAFQIHCDKYKQV